MAVFSLSFFGRGGGRVGSLELFEAVQESRPWHT